MQRFRVEAWVGLVLLVMSVGLVMAEERTRESPVAQAEPTAAAAEAPPLEGEAQLSPAQQEAARLAEVFAAFDRQTWKLVGEGWSEGEACVEKVKQHMAAHHDELKVLLATSAAVQCESLGADRIVVRVSQDEAGESYRSAYAQGVVAVEELRSGNSDDPQLAQVVRLVRTLESDFRKGLCEEILKESGRLRYSPSEPGKRATRIKSADS